MVAGSETTHAWIWIPQRGQMAIAEHGAGATINGLRCKPAVAADPTMWTAVVKKRYVPVGDRPVVDRFAARIGDPVGASDARASSTSISCSADTTLMYWRPCRGTMPWQPPPPKPGWKPSTRRSPLPTWGCTRPPRRPPRDIGGAASRSALTLVPNHRTPSRPTRRVGHVHLSAPT